MSWVPHPLEPPSPGRFPGLRCGSALSRANTWYALRIFISLNSATQSGAHCTPDDCPGKRRGPGQSHAGRAVSGEAEDQDERAMGALVF